MKSIEEAARKYIHDIGHGVFNESEFYSGYAKCLEIEGDEIFKAGVEFAQDWLDIHKEESKYYQPILADNGKYMAVVARVSDGDEDYYIICGTDIIMYPDPIKWRPIELK